MMGYAVNAGRPSNSFKVHWSKKRYTLRKYCILAEQKNERMRTIGTHDYIFFSKGGGRERKVGINFRCITVEYIFEKLLFGPVVASKKKKENNKNGESKNKIKEKMSGSSPNSSAAKITPKDIGVLILEY